MLLFTSLRSKLKQLIAVKRAVRLVWESAPRWTVASIALLIVQGTLPLVGLYLMKLIVDSVTAAISAPDKSAALTQLAIYVACAGGVALMVDVSRSLMGLVKEAQSQLVTDRVDEAIHAKSVEVDLEYYENSGFYDALHRAQRSAPSRPPQIVDGLVRAGQSCLSLIAITGLLLAFSPIMVLVIFLAALPGLFVRVKYADLNYQLQRRWTPKERRAFYYKLILTRERHAKEVRLLDIGRTFRRRFRDLRQQIHGEKIRLAKKNALAELVPQVSATIAVFGALAFIGYQTVAGVITLGSMVMYFQAFQRGQNYIREIINSLVSVYQSNVFLSDLYDFLDQKSRVQESQRPRAFPLPIKEGVAFEQVDFYYPGSSRLALKEICLTVRPGETIALVGENGSGKTTLIKLLCRLYDPTSGCVNIDGVDLREYSLSDLRRQIGVIFQDFCHYSLTARENIWLGDVRLAADNGFVPRAAKQAGVHDVIENLPQGYNTVLGHRFEKGTELSIGEWQKIALARACFRDAQLVILDEPTSSLDARAEHEFYRGFRRWASCRAVVLVSHRLSTIKMADRIYVMKDGAIAEAGSHDQLIQQNGHYARLFNMQAEQYAMPGPAASTGIPH